MNKRNLSMVILAVLILPAVFSLGRESTKALPQPEPGIKLSFDEIVYHRISHRRFLDQPLTIEEASSLLLAAGGMTADGSTGPTRAYPSAGGLYPLDFHLAAGNVTGLEPGVYTYQWKDHSLKQVLSGDVRNSLMRAALGESSIANAPAAVIITANTGRTVSRYGERGERYVLLDAGAAMQNILLKAVDLNLGSAAIGAFDDSSVQDIIGRSDTPLVIIPVGRIP